GILQSGPGWQWTECGSIKHGDHQRPSIDAGGNGRSLAVDNDLAGNPRRRRGGKKDSSAGDRRGHEFREIIVVGMVDRAGVAEIAVAGQGRPGSAVVPDLLQGEGVVGAQRPQELVGAGMTLEARIQVLGAPLNSSEQDALTGITVDIDREHAPRHAASGRVEAQWMKVLRAVRAKAGSIRVGPGAENRIAVAVRQRDRWRDHVRLERRRIEKRAVEGEALQAVFLRPDEKKLRIVPKPREDRRAVNVRPGKPVGERGTIEAAEKTRPRGVAGPAGRHIILVNAGLEFLMDEIARGIVVQQV